MTSQTTMTARKDDGEKPRMDLLPTAPLVSIAEVLTFGSRKYDAHNWRGGFNSSRVIGAAYRHLSAYNDGEDTDPESGLSHLAHLGCCVMFLLEQEVKGTGIDDRYKRIEGTSTTGEPRNERVKHGSTVGVLERKNNWRNLSGKAVRWLRIGTS